MTFQSIDFDQICDSDADSDFEENLMTRIRNLKNSKDSRLNRIVGHNTAAHWTISLRFCITTHAESHGEAAAE